MAALLDRALAHVDATLAANRREDGLVHSYNLLAIGEGTLEVEYLYAMLEGQAAALDAGVLAPEDALALLRALRESDLYRPDQHSYTLYPDRRLPGFVDKNTLPGAAAEIPLIGRLLASGDASLVVRDVRGGLHFNGRFRNAADVQGALDALEASGEAVTAEDRRAVLDAFEAVFDHHAFTGRSGTFFGYEGLGSIYWHMVSKLALGAQEATFRARAEGADPATVGALADAYYDVRAGLGGSKAPEAYGAFPADAYSHTPGGAGAKQPGMTGQVKEDILCRWGELGVLVEGGRIRFDPLLLRAEEFLTGAATFSFVDASGEDGALELEAGQLAFTLCATPVVYRRANALAVRAVLASGETQIMEGAALTRGASREVFARTGAIARIEVDLPPGR